MGILIVEGDSVEQFRRSVKEARQAMDTVGFHSRELALATTKLDEASLWFEAAIKGAGLRRGEDAR